MSASRCMRCRRRCLGASCSSSSSSIRLRPLRRPLGLWPSDVDGSSQDASESGEAVSREIDDEKNGRFILEMRDISIPEKHRRVMFLTVRTAKAGMRSWSRRLGLKTVSRPIKVSVSYRRDRQTSRSRLRAQGLGLILCLGP